MVTTLKGADSTTIRHVTRSLRHGGHGGKAAAGDTFPARELVALLVRVKRRMVAPWLSAGHLKRAFGVNICRNNQATHLTLAAPPRIPTAAPAYCFTHLLDQQQGRDCSVIGRIA